MLLMIVAAMAPLHVVAEIFSGEGTAYTLGKTSAGNCNFMNALPDADVNYAALNSDQWDGSINCGRCAQVWCDDSRCTSTAKATVQILDRCPECKKGDLDLSPSVFEKITGSSPARLNIKWQFVDCKVPGSVKYCLKGGSNGFWTAIQPTNVKSGVKSMTISGQSTTMVDSAYYYLLDGKSAVETDLSTIKVTLTSITEGGSEGTSPVIIVLAACAAIGMVALAIMAVIVKKKKLDDKRNDRRETPSGVVTRSFDGMATPANHRTDIAILNDAMTSLAAVAATPLPPSAAVHAITAPGYHKPKPVSYLFGGASAVGAVFFTHPFDLLKVHLQTSKREQLGLFTAVQRVLCSQGLSGLYQGISGGVMREGTYSTMRFAVYQSLKDSAVARNNGERISTLHNVCLGMVGGVFGGAFGNPADIVNIRMQADGRLPEAQRRGYKHAIDGLIRIEKEEGLQALTRGIRPNIIRAMLLTTGQIAAYDLAKNWLLDNSAFKLNDNFQTHVLASMVAGLVATTACAPADVVKTRLMNMKHNEYKSATDCFLKVIEHEGVRGLYKGWLPAYMRLGPQTLLTFVFMEQLRHRFL
ncbi:TPA: hypothetical protein N0F65_009146 [Lagenidium giganteum]|uniref:Expansin-like EG45 domain-containing protein n=1 Tax=Lagenidium giganteum TaxID=4803 RepID=A0AAV2YTW7_9STRA|nr:TPA: hypothetical protein N0F65_009146 [Lagenidium giganteum]